MRARQAGEHGISAPRVTPSARLVLGAVAGVWAFGFIGFFGTQVTTFDPSVRLVAAIAYGVPVVLGAAAAVAVRPHPLDVPVLGLLTVYAVVSALSVDPTASLETLALVTAYASLFLLVLRLGPGPVRQGLVIGCAAAGTAWLGIMAVRWIQDALAWVAVDGSVPPLQARSGTPWLSTDALAALALLTLPYHLHIGRDPVRRILLVAAAAGAVVVIPLSGGRIAWAGLLVAAGVYIVASRRRLRMPGMRTVALALGALALLGVGAIASGLLGTVSGRSYIWQTAFAVIGSHPLDGAGPGTFSWVRLAEAPELLNRYPVYHAHNVILQTLADGGILLLVAVALTSIVYVRSVAIGGVHLSRAHAASLASLIGFGVVLMLDELTQLPALTALAVGSAALLAADLPARVGTRRISVPRALPAIGCLVLAAVALPSALAANAARTAATEGTAAAVDRDWEAAAEAYGRAGLAWPAHASYELAQGLAAAHLGDLEASVAHYERARTLSPGDPRPLGALGVLSASPAARVEALARASRLGTMDPQFGYRLALQLDDGGDRDAATRELGRAALLDPQLLVASDLASLGFDLRDVVEALRTAVEVEGPPTGIGPGVVEPPIDIASGRAPAGPLWAQIAAARGGDLTGARAAVDALLADDPHDGATRLAARQLSRMACDSADEARHDRILELIPTGYASLYVSGPAVNETRDHIYREMGLGDYQPPQAAPLPVYVDDWPSGFLPTVGCAER
jgi:O-antigen ligase/tetratricopeptide (TPR) repeat protein